MEITEKNTGAKIPYEIDGNRITFDGDLGIDLEKRQKDYDSQVDICRNADGDLEIGAKGSVRYVAQITIPAAEYDVEEGEENENGEKTETKTRRAFDIGKARLTLWAID
ncbi:MAG: hypothetical protein LUE27_05590 [Clostridia bacterium]|nr:hypothetical protein [Clostridia bacterium]